MSDRSPAELIALPLVFVVTSLVVISLRDATAQNVIVQSPGALIEFLDPSNPSDSGIPNNPNGPHDTTPTPTPTPNDPQSSPGSGGSGGGGGGGGIAGAIPRVILRIIRETRSDGAPPEGAAGQEAGGEYQGSYDGGVGGSVDIPSSGPGDGDLLGRKVPIANENAGPPTLFGGE